MITIFVLSFLLCESMSVYNCNDIDMSNMNMKLIRWKRENLKKRFEISLPTVIHKIKNEINNSTVFEGNVNSNLYMKSHRYDINSKDIIITTTSGKIKGLKVKNDNIQYYTFLGIPYASKPRRFQIAKEVNPWLNIRNATSEGNNCPQIEEFSKIYIGNEDCLHLNINTPTLENKKLPVIVWIHGGAFKFGNSNNNFYGPQKFIKKGVIVASISYRLGVFGFLNTYTKHAPGNVGIKDIILGLRWLKKNIHAFGGDNKNICLYGVSSGAMIVEYLTLSTMSEGLFSKVISHSGSALTQWAINKDPLKCVYGLGKYLGIDTKNIDVLMEKLVEVNTKELILASEKLGFDENPVETFFPFTPSVEMNIPNEEIFLKEYPEILLKSGKTIQIPYMLGFNNLEGLFLLYNAKNVSDFIKSAGELIQYFIPSDIIDSVKSFQSKNEILEKIKNFYFQNETIDIKSIIKFIDFIGDAVFLSSVFKTINIRTKINYSPIYYYEIDYKGNTEKTKLKNALKHIKGITHGEDLNYVFSIPITTKEIDKNPALKVFSDILVTMYTNFAKFSDPTPKKTTLLPVKWLPAKNGTLNYMNIDEKLELKQKPMNKRYEFWNNLYIY